MLDPKAEITQTLRRLLGLPLAIARNAGGMKNFQFGNIRPHPSGKGTVGDYALHVQCPWRIVGTEGVVTGSADSYEPAVIEGETDPADFRTGNLQQVRLGALLGSFDEATRSWVNSSGKLVVEDVIVGDFG